MSTSIQGELFCFSCGQKQPHRLVYVGHPADGELFLRKAVCLTCGHVLPRDRITVLESYFRCIPARFLSVSRRRLKELETKPVSSIRDWPRQILTDTCQAARDVYEIMRN